MNLNRNCKSKSKNFVIYYLGKLRHGERLQIYIICETENELWRLRRWPFKIGRNICYLYKVSSKNKSQNSRLKV